MVRNWPGYAAAAWSLPYAMTGLFWWAGGGFPFAPVHEDRRSGVGADAATAAR